MRYMLLIMWTVCIFPRIISHLIISDPFLSRRMESEANRRRSSTRNNRKYLFRVTPFPSLSKLFCPSWTRGGAAALLFSSAVLLSTAICHPKSPPSFSFSTNTGNIQNSGYFNAHNGIYTTTPPLRHCSKESGGNC